MLYCGGLSELGFYSHPYPRGKFMFLNLSFFFKPSKRTLVADVPCVVHHLSVFVGIFPTSSNVIFRFYPDMHTYAYYLLL